MGAEFFIYSAISLSAEYQLNLFSTTSNADMVTSFKGVPSVTTKQGSSTTIPGFGSTGAMLHIYFQPPTFYAQLQRHMSRLPATTTSPHPNVRRCGTLSDAVRFSISTSAAFRLWV